MRFQPTVQFFATERRDLQQSDDYDQETVDTIGGETPLEDARLFGMGRRWQRRRI